MDWDADRVEVGEKIAEGAQGEICAMRILGEREHGEVDMDSWTVLKVFKQGWSLQNLQKQCSSTPSLQSSIRLKVVL